MADTGALEGTKWPSRVWACCPHPADCGRPCAHTGCRWHLWQDRVDGYIRGRMCAGMDLARAVEGLEAVILSGPSCLFDVIEPDGMEEDLVADVLCLTGRRVRESLTRGRSRAMTAISLGSLPPSQRHAGKAGRAVRVTVRRPCTRP